MIERLYRDFRFAFRTLRRDRGFCAVAVLILALGIGANTAIFSVVNALLFRPLPFRDPASLVWMANTGNSGLSGATSRVANYRDLRQMNHSFEDLTAYFAFSDYSSYTLRERGEPERLSGFRVVENFFDELGLHPQIGRTFSTAECAWNGPNAVIISHGLWERRFASDPKVIGSRVTLNDQPTTVVGVMPAWFDFGSIFSPGAHVDLLLPYPVSNETDRNGNTLAIIGRLRPGKTLQQAQAEFALLVQQVHAAHPERGRSWGMKLTGLREQIGGNYRRPLLILLGAVGLVLLIACANLSSLLLTRAASRRKEFAVRMALGASRGRLAMQTLTESMALSLCGAALGLVLAFLATRAIASTAAISLPLLQTAAVDREALLFTVAISLLTGLLFGAAPAWQVSGAGLHDALKDATRGSSGGPHASWIRNAIVTVEIALACTLLVGAGLLIRSFERVLDVDLGFQPAHTAVWRIETGNRFSKRGESDPFIEQLVRKVETVPGVESAGVSDTLPLGRNRSWGARAKGVVYRDGEAPVGYPRMVDPGYITAMQIPLRAGRNLSEHDTMDRPKVALVNESLARTLWPGANPLGRIGNFGGDECEVVGVVANVRHTSLEDAGGLEFYLPISQWWASSVDMVIRTRTTPEALAPGIRAALHAVDPTLPTARFDTLTDVVDRAVSPRRFVMLVLGGFAALALLLASLGIYGVTSYSVARRTQEIGIRMALGASAANVRLGVMRQTLALAAAGTLMGIAGSLLAARLMATMLFGVSGQDPVTFVAMALVLTAVAAIAAYVPARRASKVDPMTALRTD